VKKAAGHHCSCAITCRAVLGCRWGAARARGGTMGTWGSTKPRPSMRTLTQDTPGQPPALGGPAPKAHEATHKSWARNGGKHRLQGVCIARKGGPMATAQGRPTKDNIKSQIRTLCCCCCCCCRRPQPCCRCAVKPMPTLAREPRPAQWEPESVRLADDGKSISRAASENAVGTQ
jgi:hypothetical protein